MTWGRIGVTLADIVVALASLRGDLGALWGLFRQTKATLGQLGSFRAQFGTILESLGGSFCDMAVPLGDLGMTLESL